VIVLLNNDGGGIFNIEVCVSNQLTATQLQAIKEQLQHAII